MALQQGWQKISNEVSRLIARAWLEPEFQESFIANPRRILEQETNIIIPEGLEVEINQLSRLWSIEPSPDMQGAIWKIPLPLKPAEVADEELRAWTNNELEQRPFMIPSCC